MNVFDTSKTTTTTLPTWYTDAQKDAATKATTALNTTTPFADTAIQGVAKNFQDPNNAYNQATQNLLNIQTGNANAFLPNGQPNPQSPLGQLFAAQNAQLNQILPGVTAKEGAVGIGGGNFGSLRGQTATNTARGGALTTLAEQQAKAMLDAQNQSINAGQMVGNLQNQYGTEGINLTNAQLAGGLPTLAKYEDILGALATTLPKTSTEVTSQGQYNNAISTLGVIGALGKEAGFGNLDLSKILSGKTGISWYDDLFSPKTNNPASTGMTGIPLSTDAPPADITLTPP